MLSQPALYLSLYFKRHRSVYYDLLDRVRTDGAWEDWTAFFLDGVGEVAEEAAATTRRIAEIDRGDRAAIHALGRRAAVALSVHELVMRHVVVTAGEAATALGITRPTAASAIASLEELGILREITGRRRDRVYARRSLPRPPVGGHSLIRPQAAGALRATATATSSLRRPPAQVRAAA